MNNKYTYKNPEVVEKVKEILSRYPEINAIERMYENFDVKDSESMLILYFDSGTPQDKLDSATVEFENLYNSTEDNTDDTFTCVTAKCDVILKNIADYYFERGIDY